MTGQDLPLDQVYRKAAQYIRDHGWQMSLGNDGGPRCAQGACDSVIDPSRTYDTRSNLEGVRVLDQGDGHYQYLYSYNDRLCQSADDAVALLELLADLHTPSPADAGDWTCP